MVEFEPAIKVLSENEVDFVIVGGVAISVHSSGYVTRDLDFCYRRTTENLKKNRRRFCRFQYGTNFTLDTTIGDIDMLGEVAGVGDYEAVRKESILARLYNCDVRILTLDGLINAKRAAGRTKDLLVLPELEALKEILSETKEK